MNRRAPKDRDAGKSVLNIKARTNRSWMRANPSALNGPVIVKREGKPDEVLPKPKAELDSRRFASKLLRAEVLLRDNYRCRYCGVYTPDDLANIDHVIPWKHGGRTRIDNLVTCCVECNKRKGNRRWHPAKIKKRRVAST